MTAQHDSDPDLNEDDIPDASELLDFELIAKSQPDKGQGLWLWVVLVLILAGGGWAGWMYLQDGGGEEMVSADGVPLILAPKFELREKPADPGGMNVPDRDKLVYDRMAGDSGGAVQGVERLLPPPETPIEPPQSPVQAPVQAPAQASAQDDMPPPTAPPPVAPPAEIPSGTPGPQALTPLPAPAVKAAAPASAPAPVAPAPAPAATEPAAAAPKAAFQSTGPAGQGYLVQLSAVRTEEAARSEWARLVQKHPDVLGGLESVILRADLGTKGIFYRVRGGWFTSRAEAKAICDELARRNVGCIIAKP